MPHLTLRCNVRITARTIRERIAFIRALMDDAYRIRTRCLSPFAARLWGLIPAVCSNHRFGCSIPYFPAFVKDFGRGFGVIYSFFR